MKNILITAGIVCIVAAIIGGQLRWFGAQIPIIASQDRQVLLAVVGLLLLVGALLPSLLPSLQSLMASLQSVDYASIAWSIGWLWSPIAGCVLGLAVAHVFFAIKKREFNWWALSV